MKNYFLKNQSLISVDFEQGEITKIVAFGSENILRGKTPVFSLKLRNERGESSVITAFDCTFVSFDGKHAKYRHEAADVSVFVKKKKDGLLWRISVRNKTPDLIEWTELAAFGVPEKLKDEEGGSGEIVYPYNEGVLVTDMQKRMTSPFPYIEPEYPSSGRYSVFPNMVSSQFLAYVTDGFGIYLGLHDRERTTKHIDFRYGEGCIKLQMRTYSNASYGQDYDMPFFLDMTLFCGSCFDACSLYRKWFEKNLPKGLKKITEADDLPDWYEESPIVVAYPVMGRFDTDKIIPNKLYPYANALPYLREISEKTDSKVMSLLMHWEGTAPWAPPYCWPPQGGEALFGEYLSEAHALGFLVGLYCSGMGWTQQSNLVREYNMEEIFEREGLKKAMCSDSDGSICSEICRDQRIGYDFCPASDEGAEILVSEFGKVVNSGVDYVQALDQNHGGCCYFCYSNKHNHPPAPGKWQAEATNSVLSRVKNENVLLGCESAASEPFLANLKFSDNRFNLNYYIGLPVPLYSFIYHEYVNNFMGNQVCMMLSREEYNYSFRCAYSFIAGDMLTAVIDDCGEIAYCWGKDTFKEHTDRNVSLTILKNLNGWRRKGGKKFLHTGRMIKPVPVVCGKNSFVIENGSILQVDEVLTSAYAFGKERAQFIVNYNLHEVTVSWNKKADVYKDSGLENCVRKTDSVRIAPLSAVMIKLR